MSRVGILAIQGDVEAHARILARVGAEPVPVLREEELPGLDHPLPQEEGWAHREERRGRDSGRD